MGVLPPSLGDGWRRGILTLDFPTLNLVHLTDLRRLMSYLDTLKWMLPTDVGRRMASVK